VRAIGHGGASVKDAAILDASEHACGFAGSLRKSEKYFELFSKKPSSSG
jgi:hypothetical protein